MIPTLFGMNMELMEVNRILIHRGIIKVIILQLLLTRKGIFMDILHLIGIKQSVLISD